MCKKLLIKYRRKKFNELELGNLEPEQNFDLIWSTIFIPEFKGLNQMTPLPFSKLITSILNFNPDSSILRPHFPNSKSRKKVP